MRWLLFRGLAREQRHYHEFPRMFERATGHATAALDLPGFGTENARRSPWSVRGIVDDVRSRFLRSRGEGPWGIFGISLGGMVALDWAARFPDDFARLVVVNSSAGDLSPPWHRFAPGTFVRLPRFLAAFSALARERAILRLISNRSAALNEPIARDWASYALDRPPSRTSFARQLVAGATSRMRPGIAAPVLVLASKADRLVSWRCSERLATTLGAPLELHDTGGHDLTLDAPDWICARVAAWLGAASGTGGDPVSNSWEESASGAPRSS